MECPFPGCKKSYNHLFSLKRHLFVTKQAQDEHHSDQDIWGKAQADGLLSIKTRKSLTVDQKYENRKASQKRYYDTHSEELKQRAVRRRFDTQERESLKDLFSNLADNHPNRKTALKMLELLGRRGECSYKMEINGGQAMHAIVYDVVGQKKSAREYHGLEDKLKSNLSATELLASLFAFHIDSSIDPTLLEPLAAWSIPPTSRLLNLIRLPQQIQLDGIQIDPSSYSTTMTPAGNLSSVHIDQFDAGSLVVLLTGMKMFVTWPSTEHNLKWFAENDFFGDVSRIVDAGEKLERGKYFLLEKPGDMIVLRPGELHAVLSPVNSAVGGWKCQKNEWQEEIVRLRILANKYKLPN